MFVQPHHLLALAAARVSLECGPPALSTRHDFEAALQQAAALRDPDNDAVWSRRGGYGTMRILDGVDWDALARRPLSG